jgi:CarD family transcriptional regulator
MVTDGKEPFRQFDIDDFVVHPVYGVGQVVQIEEKQFSEKEDRQYYKVVLDKLTLWIPVDAQALIGLRPITARSELDQYRDLLKSRPAPKKSDQTRQRHEELTSRLKQGSFRLVCEVVRDLTLKGRQKPLGRSDATILQTTREKLLQEWATAAGMSFAEATNEIDTLLHET